SSATRKASGTARAIPPVRGRSAVRSGTGLGASRSVPPASRDGTGSIDRRSRRRESEMAAVQELENGLRRLELSERGPARDLSHGAHSVGEVENLASACDLLRRG